jgi:ribosomal protein L14
MLNCIDNSGAAIVECVAVMRKRSKWPTANIGKSIVKVFVYKAYESNHRCSTGDRIIVVVQKQRTFGSDSPGSTSTGITNKVRRGDVRHAVVVRARKEQRRKDGSLIKFDDNACVLINKNGDPIGTRLTSVVGAELRDKQWSKILSLAPLHV